MRIAALTMTASRSKQRCGNALASGCKASVSISKAGRREMAVYLGEDRPARLEKSAHS
jgi:hypothetical protein